MLRGNQNTKNTLVVLVALLSLIGCAGRTANPVSTSRPGDNAKSCGSLESEMVEIEGEISKRLPKSEKTGKNVALGITGLIVFPAWFFMDFKDAEKIEINAYRTRYNHLARIYNDKNCGQAVKTIPSF